MYVCVCVRFIPSFVSPPFPEIVFLLIFFSWRFARDPFFFLLFWYLFSRCLEDDFILLCFFLLVLGTCLWFLGQFHRFSILTSYRLLSHIALLLFFWTVTLFFCSFYYMYTYSVNFLPGHLLGVSYTLFHFVFFCQWTASPLLMSFLLLHVYLSRWYSSSYFFMIPLFCFFLLCNGLSKFPSPKFIAIPSVIYMMVFFWNLSLASSIRSTHRTSKWKLQPVPVRYFSAQFGLSFLRDSYRVLCPFILVRLPCFVCSLLP